MSGRIRVRTFVRGSLFVFTAGFLLAPSLSFGYGNGINGYSGSPATGSRDCLSCHGGGTAPTVTFVGPATLAPGAVQQYILRISGGQKAFGALDVSTTGGTLAVVDAANTKLASGEIIHSQAKSASAGVVDFAFNVKAPASGTFTLYGAGLSTNGSGTSGDGQGLASLPITVVAAPVNQAPVANAGGPYTVTLGDPTLFSGALSKDPDGTIASYAWNFGDGKTGTGVAPSHTYLTTGVFNVTLTVTDNLGLASVAAKTTATVNPAANMLPVANAGGPYSAVIAMPVAFDGSKSADPDGTISTYAWAFGDGAMGTGAKVTHAYSAVGNYTASLTVTDNLGATATAKVIVAITAAPTPVPSPSPSVMPSPIPSPVPSPLPSPLPSVMPSPAPSTTPTKWTKGQGFGRWLKHMMTESTDD